MLTLAPMLAAMQVAGAAITLDAAAPGHAVSPYLAGACLEDVNHEVYGGIDSQMLYGESFQEPPGGEPVAGFQAHGGAWTLAGEELSCTGVPGDQLVAEAPAFTDGDAGVEVFLADEKSWNSGLIVRVAHAAVGADNFDGYEISLDAAHQQVLVGRHRHDWHALQTAPCKLPVNAWVPLEARLRGDAITVLVDGREVMTVRDTLGALPAGTVGLRQFQDTGRYRRLWVSVAGQRTDYAWRARDPLGVSGAWHPVRRGAAQGAWGLVAEQPYHGRQSQAIVFTGDQGAVGVANAGLHDGGLAFVAGRPYEGLVMARAAQPVSLVATLENADGTRVYATQRLDVTPGAWQRLPLAFTPDTADLHGRLSLTLDRPGRVELGYALLQPGSWGRFHDLPVRRDVAEALVAQGVRVLRYGGSMVNAGEYRWKKMIGPRQQRPPYRGTWYPYSSNGWGIVDFVAFCESAGFLAVPAFNMGESPQDMADFVEYMNGAADSAWGKRRVADGHAAPYGLTHLELGNEERVDAAYAARFKDLAAATWAKDPHMILVVGDFAYDHPITDPHHLTGAASGITDLGGQQAILDFARERGGEVWFDIHVDTDGPRRPSVLAAPSFIDAIDQLAGATPHRVVIFELNSGRHDQQRAIANAVALGRYARDGRLPIVTSANCLQVDGMNDNAWDQGLLFLNAGSVWLQPPGYVTQMFSRSALPLDVPCTVTEAPDLDVSAARDADDRKLTLRVVNVGAASVTAEVRLAGRRFAGPRVNVTELATPLNAVNTAAEPTRWTPRHDTWPCASDAAPTWTFAPHSYTVIEAEMAP
jgi:hypothetical protein